MVLGALKEGPVAVVDPMEQEEEPRVVEVPLAEERVAAGQEVTVVDGLQEKEQQWERGS
jgi:translation initiation factor 1 (eIF-1/SUI1)